jgi:hypothetical protein
MWTLLAGVPAHAEAVDVERANRVKAAYLINFLRYTEWPQESFGNSDAAFRVTVIGSDALAATVQALADAARSVGGRKIQVRRMDYPRPAADGALGSVQRAHFAEQLQLSHLVYVESGAVPNYDEVIDLLRDYPVLTVSDADRFAFAGGMLGLTISGGHVLFEANPGAIHDAGLLVSAKVLKLARLVGEERW